MKPNWDDVNLWWKKRNYIYQYVDWTIYGIAECYQVISIHSDDFKSGYAQNFSSSRKKKMSQQETIERKSTDSYINAEFCGFFELIKMLIWIWEIPKYEHTGLENELAY